MRSMSDVTRILEAMRRGEQENLEELLTATYHELKRIARSMMANERSDHTLQPTALVHEAYQKIAKPGGAPADWDSRAHYFSIAAEAMRRILIDSARRRQALKRGGDRERTALDEELLETRVPTEEMLEVNEVLDELEASNEQAALVVKLRYFAGMTVAEIAAALGISKRSVDRSWQVARGFLHQQLSERSMNSK